MEEIMIRFIAICVVVVGYLILSIPLLLAEWIVGKINPRPRISVP